MSSSAGERGAIAAELGRLNAILQQALERFRRRRPDHAGNGLAALAVFDDEVDSFLERSPWSEPRAEGAGALEPSGRFRRLADLFSLTRADLDLVLVAIAPEVHSGYGRVYAYLQNDIGRTRPSAALALEMLTDGLAERLELRAQLGPRGRLARNRVLAAAALDEPLVLDEAVIRFLMGADPVDGLVALPVAPLDELVLDDSVRGELRGALEAPGTLLCLCGDAGWGKRAIAAASTASMGKRLFAHDLEGTDRAAADGSSVGRWLRDVALADGLPCLDLGAEPPEQAAPAVTALAAAVDAGTFAAGVILSESALPAGLERCSSPVVALRLEVPRVATRRAGWRQFLAAERLAAGPDSIDTAAAAFPLGMAKIRRAARDAAARARRGIAPARALQEACRAQARHRLDRLAERVPLVHGWDDLVLPADHLAQLHELCDAARQRTYVLETWAFGERVAVSPGVSALFYGPSGTGKTMAAGILAASMGMELYRADLSRVVSKYIGETEKNLDALFDEARRGGAMLLFDEADALFGKRSEVKDAHDRYANIEVAFLLQRMESFAGITILATNLRKNIDRAFLRRVQFSVEFPSPTPDDRLAIWRKVWPTQAELAEDVDFEFLASRFEWPGGNIRNIALRAAYLAAAEEGAISMRHLVAATRREFQKFGQLAVDAAFEPYRHLLPRRELR